MPRLKVSEPRQQGYAHTAKIHKPAARRSHKRSPPPTPLGADRASRFRTPVQTPSARRRKEKQLSPSSLAELALGCKDAQGLPPKKRERALAALCEAYGCTRAYPAKLLSRLQTKRKLPLNQGKGAKHHKRIGTQEEEIIKDVLKTNAYDMTFKQLEEATGIPAATLCRHFKATPGWRQCGKGTRPLLEDKHMEARAAWAKKHRNNRWQRHVDIDEKWFYVRSGRGRLKLPPGVEKPKSRLKSKRFVAKVMILSAVARPIGDWNGVVGCWRVTQPFTYQKQATYQGTVYHKGDTRMKDCEMDGDKFAEMLTSKVFPAIRTKMASCKKVSVQWDNAGGHGMSTIMDKIADSLEAPMKRGKQVGPWIEVVGQCPQSPDHNGCDLGFFNSVDSRVPKLRPYNLDDFEQLIIDAHNDYPGEKLDAIFDLKHKLCAVVLATTPPQGTMTIRSHMRGLRPGVPPGADSQRGRGRAAVESGGHSWALACDATAS